MQKSQPDGVTPYPLPETCEMTDRIAQGKSGLSRNSVQSTTAQSQPLQEGHLDHIVEALGRRFGWTTHPQPPDDLHDDLPGYHVGDVGQSS